MRQKGKHARAKQTSVSRFAIGGFTFAIGSRGGKVVEIDVRPGVLAQGGYAPVAAAAANELREYFAGARRTFGFPCAPGGTPFQRAVWECLKGIPYGQTRSYAQVAAMVGRPKAVRAVANAVGANPLLIVVPCHRVIRANGQLGGFGPGTGMKRLLLELERNGPDAVR